MKKIAIVAVAVVVMMGLAGSAFAANSLQKGKFGLSVGFGNLSSFPSGMEDTIIGKLFLADDLAAVLGFGFSSASGDAGHPDGTDFSLVVGARKYFKKDDFAPFAEGFLVYMNDEIDTAVPATETETIGVIANFGGEYFLHKQFSLEGSVGAGLLKVETTNPPAPSGDTTILGTLSMGVRATLYF